MPSNWFLLKTLTIVLVLLESTSSLFVPQDLRYQSRTNRWEGFKDQSVSNYPVELISAIVRNSTESQNGMPEVLKIKFYLNEESKAFLTVREIDNKFFYWMDGVQPDRWQKGFNDFEWPTTDVLQKLGRIDMYNLGIVVRMNSDNQSGLQEQVAPAIFYHTNRPSKITEYLFTFKTDELSDLTCDVYPDKSNGSLARQNFPRINGETPVTFVFDSAGRADGWYRLVVNQIRKRTNNRFRKEIRFYHRTDSN